MNNPVQISQIWHEVIFQRWFRRSSSQFRLILNNQWAIPAVFDFSWEGWLISGLQIEGAPPGISSQDCTSQLDSVISPFARFSDKSIRSAGRFCVQTLQQLFAESPDTKIQIVFTVESPVVIGPISHNWSIELRSQYARAYADLIVIQLMRMFGLSREASLLLVTQRFATSGIGATEEDSVFSQEPGSSCSEDEYHERETDMLYQDSPIVTARHILDLSDGRTRRGRYEQIADLEDRPIQDH